MVPHLKTPIPNVFYHVLLFYLLIGSEFSCLTLLAKPYPVFGLTPMPQIPNQLQFIQSSAWCYIGGLSLARSHIKSSILFVNH